MSSAHTHALNAALYRVNLLFDALAYRPESVREALSVLQETESIRAAVHALSDPGSTADQTSPARVELTDTERELLCSLIETVLPTASRQQYRHLADVLQKLKRSQPRG